MSFDRHVEQRTVVLEELRIVFLPVPKAACTTLLWLLAELTGIPAERFERSPQPEVSPALTVHDMALWEPRHRLAQHDEQSRERILHEDGWLRFAVVRDPASRLWSAWQSKLLMREPRFVQQFGQAPWFPRLPLQPRDIVTDFRRFVAALPSGQAEDVHWAVQHELVRQLPLTHVGRVESLGDTLALLRAHVGEERWPTTTRRANISPLPPAPDAYDAPALEILRERHRADGEHFGYALDAPAGDPAWDERVAPLLPLLCATIDEHTRIGQLHRLATERRTPRPAPVTSRSAVLPNTEDHEDFNVRWGWSLGPLRPGFTAVLRVKNEAASLPWVLPPLLRAVSEVVIIDNGSTDGTPDVARAIAAGHDASRRLAVHDYPFAVARCGEEHLSTPAASVHSLAYFYNWSFAHVRTTYALKWDGDMVLSEAAIAQLRDLSWQLEATHAVVRIPRLPLYLDGDRRAYLDVGMRNIEPWAWPNRPGFSFVKAMEWELPMWGDAARTITLPNWGCVELKHLDADEFAHWSPTDFEASTRTKRKQREWEVFQALRDGSAPPDEVVAIDAPAGTHIVEHVRRTVLARFAREGAAVAL